MSIGKLGVSSYGSRAWISAEVKPSSRYQIQYLQLTEHFASFILWLRRSFAAAFAGLGVRLAVTEL